MDRRILTIVAVAVLAAVVLAPAAACDTDADSAADSQRYSTEHLLHFQAEVRAGDNFYIQSSLYAFRDGSYEDTMMDRYIADPDSVDIVQGEFSGNFYASENMVLNVYFTSDSEEELINFNGEQRTATSVLAPYGENSVSFFVLGGDTFRIDIDYLSNRGDQGSLYLDRNGYTTYIDSGYYEYDVTSPTNFIYRADSWHNSCLYWEIQYTASGFSSPSGSPTMYFVICAVITVAVLAILAYAGLKPRWSKDDYVPSDGSGSSVRSSASSGKRINLSRKQMIAIGAVAVIAIAGVAVYYVYSNSSDPSPVLKERFEAGDYYTYETDVIGDGTVTYRIESVVGDMYVVSISDRSGTETMSREEFLNPITDMELELPKTGSEVIDTNFGRLKCDVYSASESGLTIKYWVCNGVIFQAEISAFGESASMTLVDASIFV